ncbi:hypothetical protein [Novilysobacter arseniciresistens]|uniref:hypothetical protein n=1 Tax=Novilysobacter arseniciresistens TaxID=1385522 RepID=UPI0013626054|nr:hypothetical protein [Lysobacter arseniciresistens]
MSNNVRVITPPPRDAWALAFVRQMAEQKRSAAKEPKRGTVIDFRAAKRRLRG